jgi:hypothetical protein
MAMPPLPDTGQPPLDPVAHSAEIAVIEGRATLDRLLKAHEELRPRLLSLFSAAGASVAILVGLAVGKDAPAVSGWVGKSGAVLIMGGFTTMALALLMVWRPQQLPWGHHPSDIVAAYVDRVPPYPTDVEVNRQIALSFGQFIDGALQAWRSTLGWVRVSLAGFLCVVAGSCYASRT